MANTLTRRVVTIMSFITITFHFNTVDGSDVEKDDAEFDVDGALNVEDDIHTHAEEWVDDANTDMNDGVEGAAEWEYTGYKLTAFDEDYGDPADFGDTSKSGTLNDYAEFANKVIEHGIAYRLRHDDIGDFEFDDEYQGMWDCAEDFVQNLIEDCFDLNIPACLHVDWELTARDVMMDYSEYDDSSGMVHIFRN
jgi:antirestriction protein